MLFSAFSALAQKEVTTFSTAEILNLSPQFKNTEPNIPAQNIGFDKFKTSAIAARPATIWTSDFSTAADWTVSNASSGNNDNWVIGTAVPSGPFSIPPIASTTAANGYALFDSDLYCSGSQIAYLTTTNSIDCSTYSAVILEFQQHYRRFTCQTFVDVSSDNGVNWTAFEVNQGMQSNASTANPENVMLNISSVAGNASAVKIRFRFLSDGATNGGDGCDYSWMVDDVILKEAPSFDLTLESVSVIHNFNSQGNVSNIWYSKQPLNHAKHDSLSFAGIVRNNGLSADDATFHTQVSGPITSTMLNAPAATLAPNALDTALIPSIIPLGFEGTGNYNFFHFVLGDTSETNLSDNVLDRNIEITNQTFSWDKDDYAGAGSWFGLATPYKLGVNYILNEDDTAHSVGILFQGLTNVGAQVSIQIYSENDLDTPIVSAPYFLLPNMLNQVYDFAIPATFLQAGSYYVGYETLQGDSIIWATGTSQPEPAIGTVIGDPDKDGSWVLVNNIPFIRLNVTGFVCGSMTPSVAVNNHAACASNNGSATVSMAESGNFDFIWSNGFQGPTHDSLLAGTYIITIFDADLCSDTISVTINEPENPSASSTVSDANCFSGNDGLIEIMANGGLPPYSYEWNTGDSSETLDNISAGIYSVTISDANNCFVIITDTVSEPSALMVNIDFTSDSNLLATASGGTPPYAYMWSNDYPTSNVDDPEAAIYSLTITDANNCTIADSIDLLFLSNPILTQNKQLSIYPNPAIGKVFIRQNIAVSDVMVYDMIGKLQNTARFVSQNETQIEIDIEQLHSGMYFVKILNKDGTETSAKFIKK